MTFYSERTRGFEASGIRKMFDLASGSRDLVDFSLGVPDFDAHELIKKEAIDAINAGHNSYTATAGIPELHEAVKKYWERKYGLVLKDKEVIATHGATGAVFLSLLVTVDEGDEVLIPDPYFPLYGFLVRLCGGKPVYIDTYPNNFKVVPEDIQKYKGTRTKIMIFNNPVNPTGVAYTESEVRGLAAAVKQAGLFVIADEVYNSFVYDFNHTPLMRYLSENIIHIGAMSKTHGIPGWRLGYAISDSETIRYMTTFQQFTYTCSNSVAQRACIKALEDDTIEKEIITSYRIKRDIVCELLSGQLEFVRPQGAFYIFPAAPSGNADEFVNRVLENRVVTVSGKIFSQRNSHFRISYSVQNDRLKEGLRRITCA